MWNAQYWDLQFVPILVVVVNVVVEDFLLKIHFLFCAKTLLLIGKTGIFTREQWKHELPHADQYRTIIISSLSYTMKLVFLNEEKASFHIFSRKNSISWLGAGNWTNKRNLFWLTRTKINTLVSPMRYFPSETRIIGNCDGHVHFSTKSRTWKQTTIYEWGLNIAKVVYCGYFSKKYYINGGMLIISRNTFLMLNMGNDSFLFLCIFLHRRLLSTQSHSA